MIGPDLTATAALSDALRVVLAAISPTIPGYRGAALLLLGHTCDATVRELVSLDIADVTATREGLALKIRRQDGEREDLISLSRQRVDPTNCAVAATRRLLDSLHAAGRTDGPLLGLLHDRVTSELACPVGRVGRMSLCPSPIRKSSAKTSCESRGTAARG